MKRILLVFLVLIAFTAGAQNQLPFQGKLVQDGNPVNGNRNMQFEIPEASWSETFNDVFVLDGFYSVVLGSNNPLPEDLFASRSEVSLNITVGGTALSPVTLYAPIRGNLSGNQQDLAVYSPSGDLKAKVNYFESNDSGSLVTYGKNNNLSSITGSTTDGYGGYIGLYDSLGRIAMTLSSENDGRGLITIKDRNQNSAIVMGAASQAETGFMATYGPNGKRNIVLGSLGDGYTGYIGVADSLGKSSISLYSFDGTGVFNISNGEANVLSMGIDLNTKSPYIGLYGANFSPNISLNSSFDGKRGNITVHNESGNGAVDIQANDDNKGLIFVRDQNGNATVKVSANSSNNGELEIYDQSGFSKVLLNVFDSNNSGSMVLSGANGSTNLIAGSTGAGSHGYLSVYSDNGTKSLDIYSNSNNNGELSIYNNTGQRKLLLDVFNANDAGGVTVLGNNDTNNVIVGSRSAGSHGFVGIYDDAGQRAAQIIASDNDDGQIYLSRNGSTGLGIAASYNATGGGGIFINNSSNTKTIELNGQTGTVQAVSVVQTSDGRLKTNITPQENALDKVKQLQGVNYQWKSGEDTSNHIGFIAQDVEKIYPEMVYTKEDGYKAVNYAVLVSALVESIKTLDQKIEALEAENSELKAEISKVDELKAEIEGIKTLLINQSAEGSNVANK